MTFDYWVELSESTSEPSEGDLPEPSEEAAWNLASGFVDRCVEWLCAEMTKGLNRAKNMFRE
jgi:hypothetical protein